MLLLLGRFDKETGFLSFFLSARREGLGLGLALLKKKTHFYDSIFLFFLQSKHSGCIL